MDPADEFACPLGGSDVVADEPKDSMDFFGADICLPHDVFVQEIPRLIVKEIAFQGQRGAQTRLRFTQRMDSIG